MWVLRMAVANASPRTPASIAESEPIATHRKPRWICLRVGPAGRLRWAGWRSSEPPLRAAGLLVFGAQFLDPFLAGHFGGGDIPPHVTAGQIDVRHRRHHQHYRA